MTKWLRLDTARKSEIYRRLVDEGVIRLTEVGYFSKADLLKETGLDVFDENDIRWDYVRRIIEEDPRLGGPISADDPSRTELIPLVAAFFKRFVQYKGDTDIEERRVNPKELAIRFPERFIAQGYGKRTAGFAIASRDNGHFVTRILKTKRAKAKGATDSANHTLQIGRRILGADLPYVELPSAAE